MNKLFVALIFACSGTILFSMSAQEPSLSVSRAEEDSTNESKGVIDDPDGYVNLRNEKSANSSIVAKVKKDEPFDFECKITNEQRTDHETWCKVKLASGVTGWMHYSRIKFFYTQNDLPKGPENSGGEIAEQTREQGVNYYKLAQAAARGDKKALIRFFTLSLDGAAAETHVTSEVPVVIHLLGDDKFAEFLREQPRKFRENVSLGRDLGAFYPFDSKEYFRRHFPKSAKLVFTDSE